ncbi:hypothetical protein O6H91_07G016100 [Diphasiastrum complanatum]|uniref:Uncharacterized protein n=1 Tax=Diphasiastrum complanatum TaxID=34168 RepID=A0ACC2D2T2_DIPCM|nr:hypothetical protein O6H91_07G016100 [Diphasiastrum complanatum]
MHYNILCLKVSENERYTIRTKKHAFFEHEESVFQRFEIDHWKGICTQLLKLTCKRIIDLELMLTTCQLTEFFKTTLPAVNVLYNVHCKRQNDTRKVNYQCIVQYVECSRPQAKHPSLLDSLLKAQAAALQTPSFQSSNISIAQSRLKISVLTIAQSGAHNDTSFQVHRPLMSQLLSIPILP